MNECVDPGLVTWLLPEPSEQISIKSDGYDFLARWDYDLGILPELLKGFIPSGSRPCEKSKKPFFE